MSNVFELAFDQRFTRFAASNIAITSAPNFSTNGVSTSAPSGNTVYKLPPTISPQSIPNGVMLKPFAVATNGQTATCNIYGWKPCAALPSVSSDVVYIRTLLYQIVCTFSSTYQSPISSANVIGTTPLFCSTITMTSGYGNLNIDYYFQGLPMEIYFDAKSSEYLEILPVSGNATSVNFLIQRI